MQANTKIAVKICGLTRPEMASAAARAGAAYIGIVFVARSRHSVSLATAHEIAAETPRGVGRVGLFVDPSDDDLFEVLRNIGLDYVQLHGQESPERVADIKKIAHLPVIKAIPVATAADLEVVTIYEPVADMLLFDARPPAGTIQTGGNGVAFDWSLLTGFKSKRPWMLAGGLNPNNVTEAIGISGARIVDVSSGVENESGFKDISLVEKFVAAATIAP